MAKETEGRLEVGGMPEFQFGHAFGNPATSEDDAPSTTEPRKVSRSTRVSEETPDKEEPLMTSETETGATTSTVAALLDDTSPSAPLDNGQPTEKPRPVKPERKKFGERMHQAASAAFMRRWVMARAIFVLVVAYFAVVQGRLSMSSPMTWVLIIVLLWFVYVAFLQQRLDKTTTRSRPTMGWKRAVRSGLRAIGLTYVPKQSKREHDHIEALHLEGLIELEEREQFNLAQTRTAFVVVFGPSGGVGKSTIATAMAHLASGCNYVPNLIIDARNKRGHITERAGLWRRENPYTPLGNSTLTLRQTMRLSDEGWLDQPTQTQTLLGSVPGRLLYVVASDMVTEQSELEVDMDKFLSMLWKMLQQFKLVFAECADELFRPFDITLMKECTIPVFTHRVTKPGSRAELVQAMSMYSSISPEIKQKISERGVLEIIAAESGDTPEQWSEIFGGIIPPERTFLIPSDPFFTQDNTDLGHDTHVDGKLVYSDIDYSAPPRRTLEIDDMPSEAELQIRRAFNAGLRTVEVQSLQAVSGPRSSHA